MLALAPAECLMVAAHPSDLAAAATRGLRTAYDQAMLELRATYLNGEWDAFWAYHVEQEDGRLYRKLRETG